MRKQAFHLLSGLFLVFLLYSCSPKLQKGSDFAGGDLTVYNYKDNTPYQKVEIKTYYLTMRDGVRLAVDVYLPKNHEPWKQLPTILHQTRYWRRMEFRWPFDWFLGEFEGPLMEAFEQFVLNGYAVVNVDVRGSGASFGSRKGPWSPEEVQDGVELVDWIIKQDWSNGFIGSMGVSYTGGCAEFLAVHQHPAVKAIMPMYAFFDLFDDTAFPGGVHNTFLTKDWSELNAKLDRNAVWIDGFLPKLVIKGASHVKGQKRAFKTALKEHQGNLSVDDEAVLIDYRDDHPEDSVPSLEMLSAHSYCTKIDGSPIPVYSYSGWLDGAGQHSAIRRFLNYSHPDNKLIIGPWAHGGLYNISPFNPGRATFDHFSEVIKFFDFHLKGVDNGLDKEARVHYFTLGEEKWKASDVWPPKGIEMIPVYFAPGGALSLQKPAPQTDAWDVGYVDNSIGSGKKTRWNSVTLKLGTPHAYPERRKRDSSLMVFEMPALESPMEITGHPIVHLSVESSAQDGLFIAYLEDVAPNGKVRYVTEGLLRGIHRKVSEAPYKDVVPYHSFLEADAQPMEIGEISELVFDMLPTSYLFQTGHKIRISISFADKDHFEAIVPDGTEIRLWRGGQAASWIELPHMTGAGSEIGNNR